MKHGRPFTPCCQAEEWRWPIEAAAYLVSSCGRIMMPDHTIKSIKPRKDGYMHTTLWDGERIHGHYLHRLVCRAFYGRAPEEKPCAAHGDGNRSNNHAKNLRWASYEENEADKVAHGTRIRGVKHVAAKLDFDTRYV